MPAFGSYTYCDLIVGRRAGIPLLSPRLSIIQIGICRSQYLSPIDQAVRGRTAFGQVTGGVARDANAAERGGGIDGSSSEEEELEARQHPRATSIFVVVTRCDMHHLRVVFVHPQTDTFVSVNRSREFWLDLL